MKYKSHSDSCLGVIEIPRDFDLRHEFLTAVDSEFEGRVVRAVEFKVDDPLTSLKGLRPVDFCLENQIAAGVKLNPAFSTVSSLPLVDDLSNQVSVVANYIETSNSNSKS